MELAKVLGLDTRKQYEKGLLNKDMLLEMIAAIIEKEKDAIVADQQRWEPIGNQLDQIKKDLDTLSKKQFEEKARQLRELAHQVMDILKNQTIEFKQKDKLKKVRLDDSELETRLKNLSDRVATFEKIVAPLQDTSPSTRVADIKKRLLELRDKLKKVTQVKEIIECEQDASEIFRFDEKTTGFNRNALKTDLQNQITLTERRLNRDDYDHTIKSDIHLAKKHLDTVGGDQTSEVQTLMAHKLGLAICDKIATQVLDSKSLKLPKKGDAKVAPAITKLEKINDNIALLTQEVGKLATTKLEQDEFTQLIEPQLKTLTESVKQILEPVVELGKNAVAEKAKLKPDMAPELEQSINNCFLRLKLAAISAQTEAASHALLSNWSTCAFFDKEDVAAHLKSLADL